MTCVIIFLVIVFLGAWTLAKSRSLLLNVIVLSILAFCLFGLVEHVEINMPKQLESGVGFKEALNTLDFDHVSIIESFKSFLASFSEKYSKGDFLVFVSILFVISLIFVGINSNTKSNIEDLKRSLRYSEGEVEELEKRINVLRDEKETLENEKEDFDNALEIVGSRGGGKSSPTQVIDENALKNVFTKFVSDITKGVVEGVKKDVANLVGRIEKTADGLEKSVKASQEIADRAIRATDRMLSVEKGIEVSAEEMKESSDEAKCAAIKAETTANNMSSSVERLSETTESLSRQVGDIESAIKITVGAAKSAEESSTRVSCVVESAKETAEILQESCTNVHNSTHEICQNANDTLAEARGKAEEASAARDETRQMLVQIKNAQGSVG